MEGVVESFEDIGATTYTTENLILDSDMTGTGVSTDWSVTANDGAIVQVADGFGFINAPINSLGEILLTQPSMEIGASYTISFDYGQEDAGSPDDLTFTISDGVSGVIFTFDHNGSGSELQTFIATDSTTLLAWTCEPTSDDTQYRVTNVVLTKTVTK
jgi:hypothetical protein